MEPEDPWDSVASQSSQLASREHLRKTPKVKTNLWSARMQACTCTHINAKAIKAGM